ncbi:hypothetical protein N7444_002161 [Penicillium canescens]|nr:hypothetical protein N7444_002161 [Penicillium canescens]
MTFSVEQGKLTKDHRKTMNELVNAINTQISAAVKRAGDQVKFVNYDYYVGHFNSRFCEDSVDESTKESNTRSENSHPEDTFEGSVNQLAQITLLIDPDAKLVDKAMVSDEHSASTVSIASFAASKIVSLKTTDVAKRVFLNILPDGYGRIIASLVIYEIANKNEQDNRLVATPERLTFDSYAYDKMPILVANVVNGLDSASDHT